MGRIATWATAAAKLGLTHSSNKCITKKELISNYRVKVDKLSSYQDNQLVDIDDIIKGSKIKYSISPTLTSEGLYLDNPSNQGWEITDSEVPGAPAKCWKCKTEHTPATISFTAYDDYDYSSIVPGTSLILKLSADDVDDGEKGIIGIQDIDDLTCALVYMIQDYYGNSMVADLRYWDGSNYDVDERLYDAGYTGIIWCSLSMPQDGSLVFSYRQVNDSCPDADTYISLLESRSQEITRTTLMTKAEITKNNCRLADIHIGSYYFNPGMHDEDLSNFNIWDDIKQTYLEVYEAHYAIGLDI